MQTYAVLGSTGNIGSSLIRVLLDSSPSVRIHAFCRSKSKLLTLFPDLDERVTVFEGNLTDTETLASCLEGTSAAFLAVAEINNIPGTSIAMDTAWAVVTSLRALEKRDPDARWPRLVILSSASTEPSLASSAPGFLLAVLHRALSYVYDDLDRAEAYLRAEAEKDDRVQPSFIKPNAISHDVKAGHVLSTKETKGPISFLDVAGGMVEVAQDTSGQWVGKSVAVNPMSDKVAFPREAPGILTKGLLFHFFPWLYRLGF